jgi:outer membrane protein OmpA-like peptidoglycan-associated protein
MKKLALTPILIAIAVLVGACSTTPRTTSQLDQARIDFAAAQNNPNVARFAASEMQQAGAAMIEANAAADHNDSTEKVDRLANIADRKVIVAQEAATQRYTEAEAIRSANERNQIRLDQRTNEADQAKNKAAQSQLVAEVAIGAAAEADRKTLEAQRMTSDAQIHAAQLQAQLDDLAAKKTDRGIVITLGDVLFGTDQALLNQDGMRTAQKLADVLQQNPQRSVLVEGFTDNTGNTPHNQELSERRAAAVRNTLTGMGIDRDRVEIQGYGSGYPVAANDSSSNRQLNRRVEIILSDDSGKISRR